jgi:Concanavalin A-like lectin/glucanases superfamily
MARQFVKASNQYLSLGSALLTTVPISFAFWYMPSVQVSSNVVFAAISNTAGSDGFDVALYNADRLVRAEAFHGSTDDDTAKCPTNVGSTVGILYHICAVYAANSGAGARLLYVNGANPGSSSVAVTPASLAGTYFGGLGPSGPFTADAILSWSGIWRTILTPQNALSLAQGAHPRKVQPGFLVSALNLTGSINPEPDYAARATWAFVGTGVPTEVANPPIFF